MKLGKINRLKVNRISKFGTYLVDDENNEVLLPEDYEGDPVDLDEVMDVFIYLNSEDQYVASYNKPLIETNRFAFLEAKDVNRVGAFMDMGMPKDLMVPFAEQTEQMYVGNSYLVFMMVDEETDRLVGSCKENEFVFTDEIDIEEGDEVDILMYRKTDLGMHVIVNNLYKGLVFNSNIHKKIYEGDTTKGYVRQVREDGKIDISLEPLGYRQSIDPTSDAILKKLDENDGQLPLNDKSSPDLIKRELGLSKKAFKRGIGNLYKLKKIAILKEGIRLL